MPIPKSAFNPLQDLYDLIEKGNVKKDVQINGKTYTFKTLCDEDYTWRDKFVDMSSPAAMLASQRSPTLAVATVAVDGIPVEQIDGIGEPPADIPLAMREIIVENSKFLPAYNLHTKVYSKLPRATIVEMYNAYMDQIEVPARTVGEDKIKNS